jgi:hypothetical protein
LATFKAWINASNVGKTTSRSFCGSDVEAIVEGGGIWCEESARAPGCEKEPEALPHANIRFIAVASILLNVFVTNPLAQFA